MYVIICKYKIKQAANDISGIERPPPLNDWFDDECEKITESKI